MAKMIVHNGRRYRPEDAKRLGIPVPAVKKPAKKAAKKAKNKARDVTDEATGAAS